MDAPKFLILFLFAATVAWTRARPGLSSLRQGSSLKVEEESNFLVSPHGTFSSGFYKVGTNVSCYSIWYTKAVNKTVVWMANRDTPVSERRSKLALHRNGNLLLTDGVGSTVWSTNTLSNASMKFQLQLLETGNLVLINHIRGSSGRVLILPQIHSYHLSNLTRAQPWWP
ncbi:hypothetical protein M0R45_029130 [Rubus argutus]|uniref:Bulb-type lectin domain-containing protein n=1 Tax=Rubus argutus TaxID=59490 RepID=A0AAW1W9W4_RUBAR